MAGEMFCDAGAAGEDQACWVNAARLRLTAKIAFGRGIVMQQPDHAARNVAQQPHPDIEYRRGDFVAVVEAAEYEACLRQSRFRAAWRALRDAPFAIIDLIGIGKLHDFFAIECLLVGWR